MPHTVASHRRAPRRGRISALALSLGVTILIGATAVGVIPQIKNTPAATATATGPATLETAALAALDIPKPKPAASPQAKITPVSSKASTPALPPGSGTGYRIVFDQSDQRVWLVGADGKLQRSYLVSGSRFNNLHPGTFSVLSRSRYATSFDFSGKLEYFVHFTTGFSAPIGFHAVPKDNAGRLEQTKAQLGTPLSAGCVRQWLPDAIALWDFAPVGTKVVVTA